MPKPPLKLPTTARGVPLPWIAQAKGRSHTRCLKIDRCWVCGEPLGTHLAWVIPPAGLLTSTANAAPAHRRCAEFVLTRQRTLSVLVTAQRQDDLPRRQEDGISNEFFCILPPLNSAQWHDPANPGADVTRERAREAVSAAAVEMMTTAAASGADPLEMAAILNTQTSLLNSPLLPAP